MKQTGVSEVHDLHIWALSTTETALTAHLVRPERRDEDSLLAEMNRELGNRFQIRHATFQFESGAESCHLAPDHVV